MNTPIIAVAGWAIGLVMGIAICLLSLRARQEEIDRLRGRARQLEIELKSLGSAHDTLIDELQHYWKLDGLI